MRRTDKLVRELVLDDPTLFVPLVIKKRGKEIDYEAKTVADGGATCTATIRRPQRTPPIGLRFNGQRTFRENGLPNFSR